MSRTDLRLIGPVLNAAGLVRLIRLAGTNLIRLTGLRGADLRPVGLNRASHRALDAFVGDQRTSDDGSGRTAFVLVEELLPVLRCLPLVLQLGRHGGNSRPSHGDYFGAVGAYLKASSTAVIGDAGVVIHDHGTVVDVGDIGYVNAVDGAVVVEVIAAPVASVIAPAGIAETVLDAAVEAYIRTPVAAMEAVAVVIEAPVAGGPKRSVVGGGDPCAGDPVVTHRRVGPVARGPNVVGTGGVGLHIDWERRRRLICLFNRLLTGIGLIIVVLIVVILVVGCVGLIIVGIIVLVIILILLGTLLVGRGRSCLSSGAAILVGPLLAFVLHVLSCRSWGLRCGLSGIRLLAVIRGSHIRIGGVGARVICRLARVRLPVASRNVGYACEHGDTDYEAQ